jgi:hypothetical protein
MATRKMVFPMVDGKRPTLVLSFVLLSFEISNFRHAPKIIEITRMITRCGQMVNDKRQPIPIAPIDRLFKIVRGRGLVRRSGANDHFLQ